MRDRRVNLKTTTRLCAIGVAGAALLSTGAGAATRFGTFGNLKYDDCQYETDANLVLREFPAARISTNEVVRAWRENGATTDQGLTYLEDVGFDGHRAAAATLVTTRAQIIAAANAGGVWAGLSWGHAVAIIRATTSRVVVVDDGLVEPMSWWNWYAMFDGPGSTLYAITWAQVDTEQLNFDGLSTTGGSPTMAPQVEPVGATAPIDLNVFVNDGYQFEGWSTNPQGPVQYADGADYTFTKGATLYAIWSYCDCS